MQTIVEQTKQENKNASANATFSKKSKESKKAGCKATFLRKRADAINKRTSDSEAELRWYESSNTPEADVLNEDEMAPDTTQADRAHSPEYDPFTTLPERASDTTPGQADDPVASEPERASDSPYSRVENRGRPFSRVPLWHLLLKHSGSF